MDVPSPRLTTILASDVVGYSLLTSQNEERTVPLVRQRFATVTSFVAQHEGRVFSAAGDSLLAEFSSPVEAVRCALEIQEAMKATNSLSDEVDRLLLRIGINLGDVMINGKDLLGDGVNVAARLEGLALWEASAYPVATSASGPPSSVPAPPTHRCLLEDYTIAD